MSPVAIETLLAERTQHVPAAGDAFLLLGPGLRDMRRVPRQHSGIWGLA